MLLRRSIMLRPKGVSAFIITLLWAREANRKYQNRKSGSHLRLHIGNEAHNHS